MADTAAVPAGQPAKRRSRGIPERRLAAFMVAPSMVLIALVALWPIIYAIWLSLHEYSLRQAGLSRWAEPAGLGNYIDALAERGVLERDAHHVRLHDRLGDPRDAPRARHGAGHALGLQGPGPAADRRARPVGGAHGRHGDHVEDDLRPEPRLREHAARDGHRLARRGAAGADGDDLRRRLEDGAVHGAAAARRAAGDTRGDLRGGQGRRRDGVAALPARSRCRC